MDFRNKVALVTGGSSGIGLATASLLAAYGAHVWLVARDRARLDAALATLMADRSHPMQSFGGVSADVADATQAVAAVARVSEACGIPDIVINSAGICHPGYFQELDFALFRKVIDVNYLGTVYMTRAVVPGMIARGSGHIVNIASAAGFVGLYGYSAYSPTKFAVRGFSDAIRAELKPLGIGVSIVFPPDTDTPQLARESRLRPPELDRIVGDKARVLSAEAVARSIVDGIARGRYVIIPGFETRIFYWLAGILGTLQYPIIDRLVARARDEVACASGMVSPSQRG